MQLGAYQQGRKERLGRKPALPVMGMSGVCGLAVRGGSLVLPFLAFLALGTLAEPLWKSFYIYQL